MRKQLSGRGPRRLFAVVAFGVLSASAALMVAPSASGATGSPAPTPSASSSVTTPPTQDLTYGIKPVQPDGSPPRGAFEYPLTPGASTRDAVSIYNYAAVPLTFELYAADAYTNEQGEYSVETSAVKPTGAGTWVHFQLPKGSVLRVPARSRVDVPVTFTIPKSAGPGDHYAGIVLSLPANSRDAQGNLIRVDSRVSTQVVLRVLGQLSPALTIENLRAEYRGKVSPISPGTAVVAYTVRNSGNISLAGHQHVQIAGPFGAGDRTIDLALPTVLPGSAVNVTVPVEGAWPLVRYTATVTIQPASRAGDPVAAVQTSSTTFWAILWTALALVIVALLLGYLAWRRWRRARTTPTRAGRHGPAPSDATPSEVLVP